MRCLGSVTLAPSRLLFVALCAAALRPSNRNALDADVHRHVNPLGLPPPDWLRQDKPIEAPAGKMEMGTWTAVCFLPEQQARLCRDAQGIELVAAKTADQLAFDEKCKPASGEDTVSAIEVIKEPKDCKGSYSHHGVTGSGDDVQDNEVPEQVVQVLPHTPTGTELTRVANTFAVDLSSKAVGENDEDSSSVLEGSDDHAIDTISMLTGLTPNDQILTFRYFDDNHDGVLEFKELICLQMHVRQSMEIPVKFQRAVLTSIEEYDSNADSRLDMRDFEPWLAHSDHHAPKALSLAVHF